MIGFIKGKVIDIEGNQLIVLTADSVGYRVVIPSNLNFLIDQEAALFIFTVVKENEISLWGFEAKKDLGLFENLIAVSGVGPRTALALIETKGADNLIRAIIAGDADSLKVSGVGVKTAQKIIIELKNKLAKFSEGLSESIVEDSNNNNSINKFLKDALAALTSLGYKEADVRTVYSQLNNEELELVSNEQDLIKVILKNI
ncbi:Holliday junction branch migration protein RuvA [Candidatus Dojkabacteria bacterium]|nr:Holliday junction branch migration protein RuvA [Candidatus Dojkabacteria bacterium]